MINQRTNIEITVPNLSLLVLIILAATSCNPTKYVRTDELLLSRNNLVIEKGSEPLPATLNSGAMKPYIRQQPNKRIFGSRFHLGLYNLSDIEKEKWPHGWLRKIGEEPVIFDPLSADRSRDQLESYLSSKGYFDALVDDTVKVNRQEAEVFYTVSPGKPYTIANIRYEIQDTTLYSRVIMDTVNCLIERGMPYDVDIMRAERQRLERYIRDIGYYSFSAENIFFRIDSSLMSRQVNVQYVVTRRSILDSQGRLVYSNHIRHRIRDVYVFPEFDPRQALTGGEEYALTFDTTYFEGIHFVSPPGKTFIKPEVIKQSLYISPGSPFSITNTEQTQAHLTALKNHRLVNVNFIDPGIPAGGGRNEGLLDCMIQLTPLPRQSFTVEFEGTNSGGNLGGAVNLIYQNKSLFRGAENFSMKLKGAYEALTEDVEEFKSSQEFGIETALQLPKFLMPFPAKENFIRRHDPKTGILAGYNYQKMPVYTRTIANLTLGYSWKGNRYTSNTINPLVINAVDIKNMDPAFQAKIDTTSYLAYSYRPVMIVGGNYSLVFNNQMLQNSTDYWYLRVGINLAGNLLSAAYKLAGATRTEDGYLLAGQPFAQFVKVEADASYNYRINEASTVVYRAFTGLGISYGNSRVMPFEEQYFGGGANDLRAWTVKTLGPGSYDPDIESDTTFLYQIADIKLEANFEYRFKLFWIMEGATFIDVGNIWTLREDPDRPGGQFKFNKFIDDMAVGTGLGLRFDIKFVMLRADVGIKLRDPKITYGSKWIPFSRPYSFRDDLALVVGIGYPF